MPEIFSRKCMRGKPGQLERGIGFFILVLVGLLIAAFLLTSGLLGPVAGNEGSLASIGESLGVSHEPLFEVHHRPTGGKTREQRLAEMLLPELPESWKREKVKAISTLEGLETSFSLPEDLSPRQLYAGEYRGETACFSIYIADMNDPRKAQQLYQHRQPEAAASLNVGRAGWLSDNSPRAGFWAGSYYTEIEAQNKADTSKVETLARKLGEQQLVYGGPFGQETADASRKDAFAGEVHKEEKKSSVQPGKARFAKIESDRIRKPEKIERYADNLYQKINGKEGMFRAFNVVDLRFGQYRDTQSRQTFDVYIYDMGKPVNAMGIYMKERNPVAEDTGIGRESYRSGSSVYFWKGQYYVNVLGPTGGEEATYEVAETIAKAIADTIADNGEPFWAQKWLPKENRVEHSFRYVATSGLGYDFLKEMFMASYEHDGTPYEMFLLKAGSPEQANELFDQFVKATGEYDEILKQKDTETGQYMTADSMGFYTAAFTRGRYFGGAFECENLELTEEKAKELQSRLPGGDG